MGGEGLVPGISKEPVEYAGQVLQVEAGSSHSARPLPKEGIGKSGQQCIHFRAGLEQRMAYGLQ